MKRKMSLQDVKQSGAKAAAAAVRIERSSEGLRNLLFDQIEKLLNGTTTPLAANSVARMADGILRTVEMELEIERQARVLEKQGANLAQLLPPTIPLGRKADAAELPVPNAPAFRANERAEREENGHDE